ncbi:GNAT family N-acetyltransferase [Halobacterium sp. R2-5]|uniref:GNAT family N-acetyltransferase n=1 Tax=Halobacterium sp. R2-5 TaxID=2715751 RepID=UPI00141FB77E|nr:GNAT family N-acetyltransferase [Halobacterium sp. R2-5]NIC00038.1 GNAT family N-acetyltransferase [Halobacterium sp. R2-5]
MTLREPSAADAERIGELVESSMTTSFSLSPQQIERIAEAGFDEDAVTEKLDSEETLVRVAETSEDVETETVVGYVEGQLDGEWGELRWLFVDPEHRGKGIGTELFESMRDALEDAGASEVRATTLEANTEGPQFFERFGLEQADEREVEVGDESLVERVYVASSADVETDDEHGERETPADMDLPGTETEGETTTATTEDGQRVVVSREEHESGTEAPFFAAYTDESRDEQYGFYCGNCGSLDVTMDDTERLNCPECGNAHAARSDQSYDDSYL